MSNQHSTAKYVFYYLLILISLGFASIGIGQIIWQVINSLFPETTYTYDTFFSQDVLRFGLSSVIIAGPLYWYMSYLTNKDLESGKLRPDSALRKWMTYLILLASSLVVLGFLIGLLNSFLAGELTVKFILKALAAIILAGAIFLYYLHDIRRVDLKRDQLIIWFGRGAALLMISGVILGFFFIDSPAKARALREDQERLNRLQNISYQVEDFYRTEEKLPKSFDELKNRLTPRDLVDPVSEESFEYKPLNAKNYQLCAVFAFSNREGEMSAAPWGYPAPNWFHDAGRYCFDHKVEEPVKPILGR
ncbi:MAG: DUF5671 domain-containing protein [bacterium]|nr:DUF5671 domain-containing protein [bacterium]